MFLNNKYNEIIEIIYQTATEPAAFAWFIDAIVNGTHIHAGALTLHETDTFHPVKRISTGMPDIYKTEYLKEIHHYDLWSKALISKKEDGRFIADHTMVSRKKFNNSPLANFCKNYDIYSGTGAHWTLKNNLTLRINFNKNETHGLFNIEELIYLNSLAKHFSRALSLHQQFRLNEKKAQLLDHIEKNHLCIAAISTSGKILSATQVFNEFLSNKKQLNNKNDCLSFSDINTQQNFEKYLRQVKYSFHSCAEKEKFTINTDNNLESYQYTLTPILTNKDLFSLEPSYYVIISITPRPSIIENITDKILSETSLTKTELEVCLSISRGLSIKDIANKKCRSEHTIRTQLKKAQKKLVVNSQAALVSKIFSF